LKKRKDIIGYNVLGDDNSSMRFYSKDEENYRNRNINPIYAAFITAYARIYLYRFMKEIGFDHIYYCDTDSIFSSVKPHDKFLDNNELGKWKIEDKIKEAYFIGKKSYAYKNIDDKIINKCKGVDASKINFNQYKNLTNENNIKVVKNMFYKSYNGVKIISTERTIRTTYNKRIFDGNNSTAFQK
jgi:hypothetical protein